MAPRTRHAGFTLIELMIVVALIGILASIAIPSFRDYQLRSRRSEAYANLVSLAKAQKSYAAEFGNPVVVAPMPGGGFGTTARPWTGAAMVAFGQTGWQPEGNVFFDYDTNANGGPGCVCQGCFTATAYGDLDGDGQVSALMYASADVLGATCDSSVLGFDPPATSDQIGDPAPTGTVPDRY